MRGDGYNFGFAVSLSMSSPERKGFLPLGVFLGVLVVLAIGVATIMMAVVFGGLSAHYGLLGLEAGEKSIVLKYLGFAMGGLLVAIQAAASHMRAKAIEVVAGEHARSNRQSEAGLRQERLKSAIEHLGNSAESVRLGAAFELYPIWCRTSRSCDRPSWISSVPISGGPRHMTYTRGITHLSRRRRSRAS